MAETRRRIVKQWETASDFTHYVRYGYILKKTQSVTECRRNDHANGAQGRARQ